MVFLVIVGKDFGPMKKSELNALRGSLYDRQYGEPSGEVNENLAKTNSKFYDMLIPLIVLVVLAISFFPLTTWIDAIDGENIKTLGEAIKSIPLGDAFKETDTSKAPFYASLISNVFASLYFMARKILNIQKIGQALIDGIKSLIPALVILTLAWTIAGVIKAPASEGGFGLAQYLSETVVKGNFPLWLLSLVVFLISAAISFSTGTSWGTFSIMIPLTLPITVALTNKVEVSALNALLISVGAVLSGSIFGDRCSPIPDTTILSSIGSSCPHLEHVATQLPYALFVMVSAGFGYIIAGLSNSVSVGFFSALVFFVIAHLILSKLDINQKQVNKLNNPLFLMLWSRTTVFF